MVPINKYVAAIAVGLAMSARQEAARDCSAKAERISRSTSHHIQIYRSCMAQYGQQE
jgi:hypothetical protein